ncbi:MAG: hypothetical protein VX083_09535 [Pseudomonadota bacterium]|nr:hypothetical protein [Pseudomonadota bacterium]
MTGKPMHKSISVLLISSVLLVGCGQSRLNPLNWFGRAEPVAAADPTATVNPLIPKRNSVTARDETYRGELVAVIRELKVERTPGGAVLRVTGVAANQGSWDVRMEPLNNGKPVDGVLTYELRALPGATTVGSERTRLITAATFVSDQSLEGVRSLQVLGAENGLSSRRR